MIQKYKNRGINQHPQSQLLQMEKQIKEWQIFISIFHYSKIWKEYLSYKVYILDNLNNFNFSWYSENQKKKIKKYKNCWILWKRIIPMWDWINITYPFIRMNGEKQKLKKLLILRSAYAWTEKQNQILQQIEEIERELEMTIEEYIKI